MLGVSFPITFIYCVRRGNGHLWKEYWRKLMRRQRMESGQGEDGRVRGLGGKVCKDHGESEFSSSGKDLS